MIYPSVISLDNCTATALTLSTCLISFGIVVVLCSLATLDGISRPPFCITTDSFAGWLSEILIINPLRENKFSLWNNTKISVLFPYVATALQMYA
jgi:hypothetical protein